MKLEILCPSDYRDLEAWCVNNPQVKGFIEGYALALNDMMYCLSGDTPASKHYDPMIVSGGVMHSYAFDMKDGGRHHPVEDYETVGEITSWLLQEALDWVNEEKP